MKRVCFYAPIKNEERYIKMFVEHHMKQMVNGDMFCFVDTGSTDKTKEIMNELIQKYPIFFFDDYPQDHPFSFDFIRNYALSKIPKNIDIGIALDIDEFFLGNDWRLKIENIFEKNPNALVINKRYEDLSEETGEKGRYFIHDRCCIHSINKKISWKYPVHECLYSTDKKTVTITDMTLSASHLRNQKKERPSYKNIIQEYMDNKAYKGLPKQDIMHLYYILGNEYYSAHDYDNSLKIYKKYLELTEHFEYSKMTNAFMNNNTSVYVKLATIYKERNEYLRELMYRNMAVSIKPCRETFLMLAMYYIEHKNYEYARVYFDLGIAITDELKSFKVLQMFWDKRVTDKMKNIIEKGLKMRKEN